MVMLNVLYIDKTNNWLHWSHDVWKCSHIVVVVVQRYDNSTYRAKV